MGLFDMFRKNTSVVWRDNDGKIYCPGDACPQKCDDSCPIWCQTMALTMMKMGEGSKAIEEFRKALTIAPDFKDAWVNMAAVYGSMNNHLEANKAYKAAYAIDKKYTNALFGLIISCKNLGQFEEALKYCDEFEVIAGKAEAEKLRKQIRDVQSAGNVTRQESAIDMAVKIISHARKSGILGQNDHFPNIPEIMAEGKYACQKIFRDLIKDENGRSPDLWLAWGAYAGMGAVYHWNIDWDSLQKKGVAETLLEPRGSFAMDEYVVDSIGIGFDTAEGKTFTQGVYNLSMWAISQFFPGPNAQNAIQIAMETMQAMYLFGMVCEMERLGMK